MELSHCLNVPKLVTLPEYQPKPDGSKSDLRQWMDTHITPILRDSGKESLAFVSDRPAQVQAFLDGNPGLFDFYPIIQLTGDPDNQKRDEDGNLMWEGEGEDRTPILDPIEPVQAVVDLYAKFWDRTPFDEVDADGNVVGQRIPPFLHARISGHPVPEFAR